MDLFVDSNVEGLMTFSDEALHSLAHEWAHMDEAQRFMTLRTVLAGARYLPEEAYFMAQVFYVMLTQGAESVEAFVRAEAVAAGITL